MLSVLFSDNARNRMLHSSKLSEEEISTTAKKKKKQKKIMKTYYAGSGKTSSRDIWDFNQAEKTTKKQ